MIGDALRVEIERFAAGRCRKNALFLKAERGELDRACVRAYLADIHYLVSQTPSCLRFARDKALERDDPKLAAHFAVKLEEEVGHEAWADRDLSSLSGLSGAPARVAETSGAMQHLVTFIRRTIDREPALYLSYILFAEYFTVVIGPEWLRLLEENCGIPRSSMTVIGNHIELDRQHVEDALGQIDDLVDDPGQLAPMREVLLASMTHFETFCTELAERDFEEDTDAGRFVQSVAAHAPAA